MESIVIVGGGIVGTSLAYHLRNSDREVTLLEKRSLGAGTTGKSIACFSWYPHYRGHAYDLVTRSWEIYEPLIDAGRLSFHENGLLEVAETDATFEGLAESVEELQRKGIPASLLDSDEIREHNVTPEVATAGAAFFPSAGRLDPAELVTYFAEEAQTDGVTVETGTEVTDVLTDGDAVTGLETSDGVLEADVVVNAAGPWAPQLNEMVGLSLPLRHSFAPISVLDTTENFELPTVILEDGFYLTGERSAKVLAGHAPHESSDEGRWNAALELERPESDTGIGIGSTGERHRELVAERAPRVVPKVETATLSNEWRGIRCVTPDYLPIVGPTAVDGFVVSTGMSGWGIALGPACGQLLAALLVDGTGAPELEALSPKRFSDAGDHSWAI